MKTLLAKVLVHDRNPLLAETICAVLERGGPFLTKASSGDVVTAALAFQPDLVILNPGHLTTAPNVLLADLARLLPPCGVLAYVGPGNNALAIKCISAGFVGVVSQTRGVEVLLEALNKAKLGGVYIDACIAAPARRADGSLTGSLSPKTQALSPRERHVLEQIARGFSNKEIASRLGLSPKTVETHRARASSKLGIQRKSEIVEYALRKAWLSE